MIACKEADRSLRCQGLSTECVPEELSNTRGGKVFLFMDRCESLALPQDIRAVWKLFYWTVYEGRFDSLGDKIIYIFWREDWLRVRIRLRTSSTSRQTLTNSVTVREGSTTGKVVADASGGAVNVIWRTSSGEMPQGTRRCS